MKISAAIITYNEERNIARAIESLRCCDEIVVVDSGSNDRTVELAMNHGARVVGTTNRTIDAWETLAAKTGYTDTAKYCFTTVIRTSSGRTLALALLGAPSDDGRFADARALVAWAEQVDATADGVADAR